MTVIDGVQLIPRLRHSDDRGYVTEILRSDEGHFENFGQAYVTACYPGVVKAWHRHSKQTDYFYVVAGTMKVGLHDDRPDSPSVGKYQVVVLGERGDDAQLVSPAGVWHGMMALGSSRGCSTSPRCRTTTMIPTKSVWRGTRSTTSGRSSTVERYIVRSGKIS